MELKISNFLKKKTPEGCRLRLFSLRCVSSDGIGIHCNAGGEQPLFFALRFFILSI